MKHQDRKNPLVASAFIINLAMFISTGFFLFLTYMLPFRGPDVPGTQANEQSQDVLMATPSADSQDVAAGGAEPESEPVSVLFYAGLVFALAGLAVGHLSAPGAGKAGPALMQRHILSMALVESCALMGLIIHIMQGDTPRARSMIILGIVGIGSLFLNLKKFKQISEPI